MTNDAASSGSIRHSAFGIRHYCLVLAAIAVLCYLVLPGLHWGLPSAERNRLTLGDDRTAWRAPQIPPGESESPWEHYPNFLSGGRERTGSQPRSAFNPVRSYHPDEYVFFKSLSGMRPAQLKFFPGFFGWPALQIYIVGAALKVSSWLRWAALAPDMDFYFKNPEEMARLYVIGRSVTFLFAVGCILVVWRAAGRLFGPAGGSAAALLLAAAPLFTMNARYLTADVPMLFWISLVLLFATHIFAGGGRRWYVLAGIALGLAAATRYHGALAAFLIAAAQWLRPDAPQSLRERARHFFRSKDLWLAAGISVLVFLAFNPYIVARPAQFAQEFSGEFRGSHGDWSQFAVIGPLSVVTGLGGMFILAVLAGSLLAAVQRDRAMSLMFIGFGLPAMLLLLGRPAMARYWMPVLLLPVLLVAWAFATVHRRGLELRKPGAKLFAPALLAFVVLFTAHQSLAFARLFVNPKFDTRTRAGEWIARNVPAGSSVGVLSEPWQFELPPLNATKYNIVIIAPPKVPQSAPDFLVISDLQFPASSNTVRQSPFYADGETHGRNEIMQGYSIVDRFGTWPTGLKTPLQYGPQDMRYANPLIAIAKHN